MTNDMTNDLPRMSGDRGEIFSALSKAQKNIVSPTKNKTGRTGNLEYKYADLPSILEAVKNPLATNGLCIIQFPIQDEKKVGVETMITHESGEWISGQLFVCVQDTNAKSCGSALTYARRYAITAMLGLCPDDDDDGDASEKKKPIKQPISTTPASTPSTNAGQPQTGSSRNNAANRTVSPPVNTSQTKQDDPEGQEDPPICGVCQGEVTDKEMAFFDECL